MAAQSPKLFHHLQEATDFIFQTMGHDIRIAAPLGLGKPNQLLNDIYKRVKENPQLKLRIFTALSLQVPDSHENLGRRFLSPFVKHHWGEDYPSLLYYRDAVQDQIPRNIQVHEFYFQAGSALRSQHLQRHYQSVNYTHVTPEVLNAGINLIIQLIAVKEEQGQRRYSLSCNPDVTLDIVDLYKKRGEKLTLIGVIHPELPFTEGDAEVTEDFFSALVESKEISHQLFALPRMPISIEDHLIGFYASTLVRDAGTLQIGIGSLSDALIAALCLRQLENSPYRSVLRTLKAQTYGNEDIFAEGLYGLTEMLTDGYMHLRKAGILKRLVIDENSKEKTFVHASFFLGTKPFYQWLRSLSGDELKGLRMTRVSKVNDLFDPNEMLLRRQRVHARFFNTTMQMTALGDAMSETLSNGKVVSGVGGQYNFVAMSKELQDARSILMLRSYRYNDQRKKVSNIVWDGGHITIPRHLRDVVITEYGVADLRGKSDEECIKSMLAITDADFQEDLLSKAKRAGKIDLAYRLPETHRNNSPVHVEKIKRTLGPSGVFKPFPFGSDFSETEEKIALALADLQKDQKSSRVNLIKRLFTQLKSSDFHPELERMDLLKTKSFKERLYRRLLLSYLSTTKDL